MSITMNRHRPPLTSHVSFLNSYFSLLITHYPLLIVITLFTLLTLHQSATLPLGEASDETDHFQYLQFVAHYGHPPLTAAERTEAGYKGGLAPLYYVITAWPIALIGETTPPFLRRTDQRPERYIPNDGLGFNRVMHTLDEVWPWQGQVLAWHLIRLLSLPMGWLTLILVYALAYTVMESKSLDLSDKSKDLDSVALAATCFVAFLPRFIISSAVINDDNLVFALTIAILLIQVKILQGDTRRRVFAWLGGLFGLALITKYFSLILLPELLLTFTLSSRVQGRAMLRPLAVFLLTLTITAGPWFAFIISHFNRVAELGWIAGLAASLGEPQITNGLLHLFSGQTTPMPATAATYPLPQWFALLYASFWYEYGWMQLFAPTWVYSLYTALLLFVLPSPYKVANLIKARQYSLLPTPYPLLLTHCLLFLFVVIARYILSATLDTGQGRHLYPALPVIALAVGLGATRLPRRSFLISHFSLLTSYFLLTTLLLLSSYITNQYPTLPVTSLNNYAPRYSKKIPFNDSSTISLMGYDILPIANNGLTITLYWHTEHEPNRDYLLSLCSQDNQARAISCWTGQFVNGHYPARAWEAGDTVLDTVLTPYQTSSHLQLTVWPLDPTALKPTMMQPPVLSETLTIPNITTNHLVTPHPPTWQQREIRQRTLSPFTATLTFGNELAPLTWQLNDNPPRPFSPTLETPLTVSPQTPLNFTIQWHTRQWQAEPLVVALKLLDKDFALGGEHVARLGDRYPNVLWQPTELVSETYPLPFDPAAPPGLYQLEVSLIHQNPDGYTYLPVMTNTTELAQHLYPVTIRLLDRDHDRPPPSPLTAQLSDFIELQGYDLQANGATVKLALYWHNTAKITQNYTIFTQLIGPDNQLWAQWDNPPQAGRYPTSAWTQNDNVIDRYTLTLREGAPSGHYKLFIGMYDPATGQRLPLTVMGQPQPDNALLIETVSMKP